MSEPQELADLHLGQPLTVRSVQRLTSWPPGSLYDNKETVMLHPSTFEFLKPTDDQVAAMNDLRLDFRLFAAEVDHRLPEGPDKTYVLRKLREVAMWANVALTRNTDGSPRQ